MRYFSSTWNSLVFNVDRCGEESRSIRWIASVNEVKLLLVDAHDRGKCVRLVEREQLIVFGCVQEQSSSVLNRCGQLFWTVRSVAVLARRKRQWIKMKISWYRLKKTKLGDERRQRRTYVINHVCTDLEWTKCSHKTIRCWSGLSQLVCLSHEIFSPGSTVAALRLSNEN